MKRTMTLIVALLCLKSLAHTLVMVRASRMAEANTLATSAAFGFNGDGEDAFVQILYPNGSTNAAITNCWTWTAAVFSPERRAALSQFAAAPQWSRDVLVWDYNAADSPAFPQLVFSTNNLSAPVENIDDQP